ncbi:hypothetical protein BWQ96_00345 [Gracilariopsis chorda]|uniref:DUF917 domain-containing protein n=1 Tax=Gracilariopsis chorda TaxID=448386 RepID=A0A2V3J701_9FLOR|nr:hypothetical protein BWQ96_00345 [Gracilariopsis chorda]|eukprot:PXF50185.1 hypothetical protein BWQ96_00345 [Gracilariopsis chorda]
MELSFCRKLSHEDVQDILRGSTVLAAGGGGHVSESKHLLDAAFATGRPICLVNIDEAPSDALVCVAYNLGSVSTAEVPFLHDLQNHEPGSVRAIRLMQEKVGKISGLFPGEIGAVNIAISFYIASKVGDCFVLDADPVGRSVPELPNAMSTFDRAGLPASPIVAVTESNETMYIENVANTSRTEKILRALSATDGRRVTAVHHVLPIHKLRPHLIPNTVSKSLEIGRDMREAMAKKRDVAQVLVEKHRGKLVLRGIVNDFSFEEKGSFTVGYIEMQGVNQWSRQKGRIEVKNENMGLWVDEEVRATIPDMITVFDEVENHAVLNPNYRIGMDVVIVVLPAAEALTTKAALDAFGPTCIGISEPFKSISRR